MPLRVKAGYDGLAILMTTRTTYPITSIGAPLAEMLPQTGRWGTVFAVFQRSCYLESVDGQVFCLADHRSGEGPLTLGIGLPPNATMSSLGVGEGCQLETDGGFLRLGRTSVLSTAKAIIWEPEPVGPTAAQDEILHRLDTLINLVTPLIPSDGLACVIPNTAGIADGEPPQVDTENPALILAIPRLCRLSEGLVHSEPETIDRAVTGLLGLGPGLTPSGDDLLGGLLVALRAMPQTASHLIVDVLAGCVTRHAANKTTRISSAMLEQSARGNGSAAQHRLLRCLLGADSRSDISSAVLEQIQVGHTSGWDTLAGLSLGIHLGLKMGQIHSSSDLSLVPPFALKPEAAGIPA